MIIKIKKKIKNTKSLKSFFHFSYSHTSLHWHTHTHALAHSHPNILMV